MIEAFYSGSAAMKAQQTSIDVTANNIANVNTTGFQQSEDKFSALLYTTELNGINGAAAGTVAGGSGAAVSAVETDFSQGTPEETGMPNDYCIVGSGFFAVKDAAGNVSYTRAGSFSAAQGTNGNLILADSQGRAVLDAQGNEIRIGASGAAGAQPGVYSFANSGGLLAQGGGLYAATTSSGAASAVGGTVKQGWLEGSNVNLAQQMTGLMTSQRAYELSLKAVQTADSIAQMANQLK